MAEPFIPSDEGLTTPAPNQLAQRSPQVTQLSPKPGQKVATLSGRVPNSGLPHLYLIFQGHVGHWEEETWVLQPQKC